MWASPTEQALSASVRHICCGSEMGDEQMHREPSAMPASGSVGRTTRVAMADGPHKAPSACSAALLDLKSRVIGVEALFASALKCARGVGFKFSTQNYILHLAENTLMLAERLAHGTYTEGRTRPVHITYPKPREALSISFRDRVFQRSLNDNVLYPVMTRPFIYQNYACQKGKGTDAARSYFKAMMRRAFIVYGTNDFKVLSGDIAKYYDSMPHDKTNAMFRRRLHRWVAEWVVRTLDKQYKGEKGYNPGSQMVQIAGISYLDPFDHFMKQELRRKMYVRYMDDWHTLGRSEEELREVWRRAGENLKSLGLSLHPTKTRIRSAKDGVVFLGFLFRVTATGKVLMLRDPKRVKEVKRRLRRLAHKVRRGEVRAEALDESYRCVRACMEKGNSAKLLRNMDAFFNQVKGEINNE